MARHFTRPQGNRDRVIANRMIRFPQVRVISDKGDQLGIMSTEEAYQKAQEVEKDLVLVTEKAQPPVVKIIELSKFKYQLQRKEAENRKSARQQEIKGVRLKPFMGEGDFQTRLRQIERFLKDGDKVRVEVDFRGRAQTKKEFGYRQFEQIIAHVQELAAIEITPKAIGNKLIMQLTPAKKAK